MTDRPFEDDESFAAVPEVQCAPTTRSAADKALREARQRQGRLRALGRLGEMADGGDFEEFVDKATYRP